MKRILENSSLFILNGIIILLTLVFSIMGSQSIQTLAPESIRHTIIIDAGHGGEDGGAISCTGIHESQVNLEISIKLNDLLHLLGMQTIMIRENDISVYTEGETISAKKVSDIKERLRIANETPYAIYLSIHQNHYSDSRYWGSQVFYNKIPESKEFAANMQEMLRYGLNTKNNRKCKQSTGVYLMKHMNCTGILIECGFLSNPAEEQNLRDQTYQKKLCAVIAAATSQYVNT